MNLTFQDTITGQVVVVAVDGRVDAATAGLFESHCKTALSGRSGCSLVLDLAAVGYLSSAGLRGILVLGKHVQAAGGRLVLCGLQRTVREILAMSGFLELFPIADTQDQAIGLLTS